MRRDGPGDFAPLILQAICPAPRDWPPVPMNPSSATCKGRADRNTECCVKVRILISINAIVRLIECNILFHSARHENLSP